MKNKKLCIGVDYGTDSVRTLLIDAENGEELASSVFEYPRWKKGYFCDPAKNSFRQHPLDHIEGLVYTINEIVKNNPYPADQIRAISVDTTGSTPAAVNKEGVPLALLPEFAENPDAMFIMWKDHTSIKEAEEINALCHSWGGTDFTKYSGGIYSSEWFWSKILHVIRKDKKIRKASFSWIEHCDWIPSLLSGNRDPLKVKRSRCAAGHKAMWNEEWNGYPAGDFLSLLDPGLKDLRDRMDSRTFTCDIPVGTLSKEWAVRLGLSESVIVGTGALDAHIGAVGGEIQPYYLNKVMGTSTSDMMIAPLGEMKNKMIPGICGQVDGSIIPGMMGMEAGQSAFGDIFAWFRNVLMWPVENISVADGTASGINHDFPAGEYSSKILAMLSEAAMNIPAGENSVMALDWMNGRRTPDANPNLKGVIAGLTLGSDAPRIFRALVEAAAFGARAIVNRFIREGVPIRGIIALGGVAKKSPFIMQVMSDVLNMPIKVVLSEQTCALGASMFASVAGGIYPDIETAQKKMGHGIERTYNPDSRNAGIYNSLFERYSMLGKVIEESFL
jgi:L-ribulokinase